MRKYVVFLIIGIVVLMLHFVPVGQSSGFIQIQNGGAVTCIGYEEANQDFRLITNGLSKYQEAKRDYAEQGQIGVCGYKPVKARLFIL